MTRFQTRTLAMPVALLLLGLTHAASAQTFFPNNAVISAALSGNAVIGYANQSDASSHTNGTSPTVGLVTGGSVSGQMLVTNGSTFNMSGGSVGNGLSPVSGLNGLNAVNSSIVNISGGFVTFGVTANNSSTFHISGGLISGDLFSLGSSAVYISGGNIDALGVQGASTTNVSGGSIGFVDASSGGTLNILGGTITTTLSVRDSAALNLFGTGITATLTNPNDNGNSDYRLTGTLSDGTSINGKTLYVGNGGTAHFTINNTPAGTSVPEPGNVALLAGMTLTGSVWVRRRRR